MKNKIGQTLFDNRSICHPQTNYLEELYNDILLDDWNVLEPIEEVDPPFMKEVFKKVVINLKDGKEISIDGMLAEFLKNLAEYMNKL